MRLPKYKLDIGVIAMQGRDRILIIEDDPAVGESLRDSLTSNGFHAEWKASGGEGIRHAQSESQDLVILDGRLLLSSDETDALAPAHFDADGSSRGGGQDSRPGDRGRGHVSRGSKILNVTPAEFRILVYLAQNAGQVVSRGQILDAV